MRAFALSILIVLAAGIVFLLWLSMNALVSPQGGLGARDGAPRAEPVVESHAAPASSPVAPARSPTAPEEPAKSASATAPQSEPSAAAEPEREPEREPALEPIAASVRGVAFALLVRRPGDSAEEATGRRPLPGARITFRSDAKQLAETTSGRDGRFEARFACSGRCTLEVAAPVGWKIVGTPPELDTAVLDGTRALELVFVRGDVEVAGDVRGMLQSESGAWSAETLPKKGAVLLDLVSVDDPFFALRAELAQGADARGAPTLEFAFRDVPRGEYELTLSALDGFRWHPSTLRVSPPAAGLAFLRYDAERALPLVFHVFDARSREPITDFEVRRLSLTPSSDHGVFLHTGPIELGTFPMQGAFQWSLSADGHAAAFGDETSFVEKDGARVAEVLLEPGWSTKLLVLARDPTARPLANAEVWLDGERAGRTDASGMLVLRAKAKPKTLEVRADGFELAGNPLDGYGGKSAEQRGQVTLAFLEPKG